MRMLTEPEIASRIFSILETLSDGEEVSTSRLFARVSIAPDELLPVGSLLGIHNLLMEKVAADSTVSLTPNKSISGCTLPQHTLFILRSTPAE